MQGSCQSWSNLMHLFSSRTPCALVTQMPTHCGCPLYYNISCICAYNSMYNITHTHTHTHTHRGLLRERLKLKIGLASMTMRWKKNRLVYTQLCPNDHTCIKFVKICASHPFIQYMKHIFFFKLVSISNREKNHYSYALLT